MEEEKSPILGRSATDTLWSTFTSDKMLNTSDCQLPWEDFVETKETKLDIWALGCVIVEMATAQPPYAEKSFNNLMALMYHITSPGTTPCVPTTLGSGCSNLCAQCFQRDPRDRPSAADLLQHEFVMSHASFSTSTRHGNEHRGTFVTQL